MKVHKQNDNAVVVELSGADLAKLRKGWEVLEELAHYGRNGGLRGISGEMLSSGFLEDTVKNVATILEGVSPGGESDGNHR